MRMGWEVKCWIVLDCSGSVFHLRMDGLYGMKGSPFDRDWVNWVDSECGGIECAIFFESSSTVHYGWNWRREGDSPFHTSTLCNGFVMIEKYTPTIQNVEKTHGTIQPSILFFPSIPSILNESLSFQSTAYPFPLSNHHFTAFTPFHTNTILLYPFHCISTTSIPLHLSLLHHSSTHSHTTATTQFRSNTHTPFCVELGTPNTNNSRKPLDLCVCLFKAHTFF